MELIKAFGNTFKTKYMENLKTTKGKPVISCKFYELKYKWGDSYKYGYGWLNPENKHGKNVDIICHDGGVTYQDIENVLFIQQIKQ